MMNNYLLPSIFKSMIIVFYVLYYYTLCNTQFNICKYTFFI